MISGKRVHGKVLLAAVLLPPIFLSGCGAAKPPVLHIPWQNGEISVMEVTREGELLFYDERRIVEVDGSLLYSSEYQFTDAPQERRIHLDPETLLPRRSELTFSSAGGENGSLDVLYGEAEIRVKMNRGRGEDEKTVPLPDLPYFDNEQLDLLLRALPLEAGWKGGIRLFVPATAKIAAVNVEVTGREKVDVAAGTYDCYIVELTGLGRRAWIGVEPPCPLVKYVNEDAGTLSQLLEFYPGGVEEDHE